MLYGTLAFCLDESCITLIPDMEWLDFSHSLQMEEEIEA